MVTTIAPSGDAIVCAPALAADPHNAAPAAAAINLVSMRTRIAREAGSTRARAGRLAAERAWRIQVRPVVDAHGQAIHQLSSEPARHRSDGDADNPEHRGGKRWQMQFNLA